jgi:hypothetical protein
MIVFDYTQTSPRNLTRQTRVSSLEALGRDAALALDAVLSVLCVMLKASEPRQNHVQCGKKQV